MMAITSNIYGIFSFLGKELYKNYTLRTNRAEPLTIWVVLVVVTLGLTIKCAHVHSNMMQYYDCC